MTKNLITILTSNVHLAPVQLAALLIPNKWIKGTDMTQEQYDVLSSGPEEGRVRLTEYYGNSWWENGWRDGSEYRMTAWTYRSVTDPGNMGDYYFIPYGDYNGNPPPEPTDWSNPG